MDILATLLAKRKLSKASRVSVGKDVLSRRHVHFYIEGFIPPYLINLLKYSFHESGMWTWMLGMFRKNDYAFSKYDWERLKAPSMDGNILVIFCTLTIGLFASWAVFFTEFVV